MSVNSSVDRAPAPHASWCDQRGQVEEHAACVAALGTVVNNGAELEVKLIRHLGVPAFVTLTLAEHGREHIAPLKIDRLHELATLLVLALDLIRAT